MEFSEDGKKAEYKLAIVTFIDILGFKNIVNEKTVDEVNVIINLFKLASKGLLVEKNDFFRNTFSFSDSVVRVYYNDEWNTSEEKAIIDEVSSICNMQEMLLQEGVLVRGGLTLDYVYSNSNENTIFGPAVNKAYYLESQKAKDPRIIIDPDILPRIRSTRFDFEQLVTIDEHGLPWINYFGYIFFFIKNSVQSLETILKIMKEDEEQVSLSRDTITQIMQLATMVKLNEVRQLKHMLAESINTEYHEKIVWCANQMKSAVNCIESLISGFSKSKKSLIISDQQYNIIRTLVSEVAELKITNLYN